MAQQDEVKAASSPRTMDVEFGAEQMRERTPDLEKDLPTRMHWKEWIVERVNFSWFPATQSTGGVAVVLSECPKQFDGLQTIGTIIFIFNLVAFLIITGLMITRWILCPEKLKKSFINPPECFFYGSWWLTIATIIICMQRFGVPNSGPWLIVAIRVCFWIYGACTLLSTIVVFHVHGKHTPIPHMGMNPGILLTVFHAMLTGTIASAIVADQPPHHRLPIMVAAIGFQGYGWTMSLLYMAFILASQLEKGWAALDVRPGLFMTVGASGFTIVVLIGVARACPTDYAYFADHPMAAEILMVVATWVGIFLWIFTFFCFAIATLVTAREAFGRSETGKFEARMTYNNTWWGKYFHFQGLAFIFPNVGFTLATVFIGQELQSNAILWVSVAMTILLTAFWLFDLFIMGKVIIVSFFYDSRVRLSH